MPKTLEVLKDDIEIISARTIYEKEFPKKMNEWKMKAFLKITEKLEMQAITNIIALGDNQFEMEAAQKLHEQFNPEISFLKTVKFKENPGTGELTK